MEGHTFVIKLSHPEIIVKAKYLGKSEGKHVFQCCHCENDMVEIQGIVEEICPMPGSALEKICKGLEDETT